MTTQTPTSRVYLVIAALSIGVLTLWLLFGHGQQPQPESRDQTDHTKAFATKLPRRSSDSPRRSLRGLDLIESAPATLAGSVNSRAGEAIAGANVCAWPSGSQVGSRLASHPRCARTGPDGRFVINRVPPAMLTIVAAAPGFYGSSGVPSPAVARVQLRPGQTRNGIVLVLEPGGVEVSGIVRDLAGGTVEGAIITGYRADVRDPVVGLGATTMSGSDGEFTLHVQSGPLAIRAFSPDYASEMITTAAPMTGLEIWLAPESKIVGVVRWADDDTVVANAKVSAADETTFSDAAGRFELSALRPGRYKVAATVRGGRGMADKTLTLALGETSESVVIRLHREASLQGQVVKQANDTPCTAGIVEISGGGYTLEEPISAEGLVVFDAVPPATYSVYVQCDGMVPRDDLPEIEVHDRDIEGLLWEVAPGFVMTGRVELGDRKAVQGATVWADRGDKGGTSISDARGEFRIEGLPGGKYQVHAHENAIPDPDLVEVYIDDHDVDGVVISVEAASTLPGVVTDAAGDPVAGALVLLEPTDRRGRTSSAPTDGDGKFRVSGLRPGPHAVWVDSKWGTPLLEQSSAVAVTLSEGVNQPATIRVSDDRGTIEGTCEDGDGGPVPDAFVSVKPDAHTGAELTITPPVMTGIEGDFVVQGLLAGGEYTVRCGVTGGATAEKRGVATGSNVTIVLDQTGLLRGQARFSDGTPCDEFQITLTARSDGTARTESFLRSKGHWSIDGVGAGSYDIEAIAPQGKGRTSNVSVAGDAPTIAPVIKISTYTTVRGRLVDLDTNQPIPGFLISAKPGNSLAEPKWGDARSDGKGVFVLKDVESGKLMLTGVNPYWPRGKYSGFFRQIIARGEDTNDIGDIRLPSARHDFEKGPGELGFAIASPDHEAHDESVLRVISVDAGGPAQTAGLAVGDGIVTIDEHDVTGENEYLFYGLARVNPGMVVAIGLDDKRVIPVTASDRRRSPRDPH